MKLIRFGAFGEESPACCSAINGRTCRRCALISIASFFRMVGSSDFGKRSPRAQHSYRTCPRTLARARVLRGAGKVVCVGLN
ncbi:MAG TPA: hypothetical protein VIK01_18565 [Polyangiaceae bacterium]